MGLGPKMGGTWFVDGSGTAQGVGAGMWGPRGGTSGTFTLNRLNTVFQAETLAIGKCAEHLLENGVRGEVINICSDSQAAIKALKNHVSTSRLVHRVRRGLSRLAEYNMVTLFWIPGHQGYKGNEEADAIAKRGAAGQGLNVENEVGLPLCAGYGIIERKIRGMDLNGWRFGDSCRWYKELVGQAPGNWTTEIISMSRVNARRIVNILTGHGNLQCYLYKIGDSEDPNCRWCNDGEETPYHVIGECPRWVAARVKFYGKTYLEPGEVGEGSLGVLLRLGAVIGL